MAQEKYRTLHISETVYAHLKKHKYLAEIKLKQPLTFDKLLRITLEIPPYDNILEDFARMMAETSKEIDEDLKETTANE